MKHSQEILTQHFPEKPIIEIAEYDEPLIAALLGKIDQLSIGRSLTINYDRYADAEAAMGWFDGSFSISIDDPTTTRHFMTDWLDRFAREVRQAGGDIGHVKVAINTHDRRILVNVVSAGSPGQFQESSVEGLLKAGSVNARVALPADLLERLLTATAAHAAKEYGVELYWQSQRAFAPSRPVPTHRMS